MKRISALFALSALVSTATSCTKDGTPPTGLQSFQVVVTQVNGREPPPADAPLPPNHGELIETWDFTLQATGPTGEPIDFDGVVRIKVEPGAVVEVHGEGASGRNIRLVGGKATGTADVTAVYGPARLWVEDLGYVPAAAGTTPLCSDGEDDDGDVLIDFPTDPGCAFADDDTEEEGTFSAGVSGPVFYSLPTLADIQGYGSTTPYPFESIRVRASGLSNLVVTRVAKDGFYVTDLGDSANGYNHIFAFNFSTPAFMQVCDQVTYLAGTVNEFFGFTELSFPSFKLRYPGKDEICGVPEPTLLTPSLIADQVAMERVESSLVRIEGFRVAKNFGPLPAVNNVFSAGSSSCDLNGDGQVDFLSDVEGSCGNACSADPDCSEWTGFAARGNFKVRDDAGTMIQIQTGAAPGFDPTAHKGETLAAVTGTLRNFSGGTLNWTIESRCQDDVVCDVEGCCPADRCVGGLPLTSKEACVILRTFNDPDQATN